MSHLGEKLKELRGSRSLYEVGKACSLVPNDISRYEQGKRVPSAEVQARLASFYEIPYPSLRKYYYMDLTANDPQERAAILEWAKEVLQ